MENFNFRFKSPIDGWTCTTEMSWYMTNKTDYFNSRYQQYGLNVQAMCDNNLWIIYIYVTGLGKMNNMREHRRLTGL